MNVSALPVELQEIIAQEYIKISDTSRSFYDKWRLAKQLDKHYDATMFIKIFDTYNKQILNNRQLRVSQLFDDTSVSVPFPDLTTKTPCIEKENSHIDFWWTYNPESSSTYNQVMISRYLPCIGCQRNQACTDYHIVFL